MKTIAFGILTTMLTGLLAWAGNTINELDNRTTKLELHKTYMHEDIKEIKQDVKLILRRIRR